MSVSEAQKRATLKWQKEKTDEVRFRVPKGERARIQAHAEQHGESATAFIKRAIREAMERDNSLKTLIPYTLSTKTVQYQHFSTQTIFYIASLHMSSSLINY